LGGESVAHAHADDHRVVLTTLTTESTRRVRLFAWETISREAKTMGELVRKGGAAQFEESSIIEIIPHEKRLLFLDTFGSVSPYSLVLRGFGKPWKLFVGESKKRLTDPIAAVADSQTLWILTEQYRIVRYALAALKPDNEEVVGECLFNPGPVPMQSDIECALTTWDGFDLLFRDGNAWNYSFSKGWSQVGSQLASHKLLRLADHRAVCLSKTGEFVVRSSDAWTVIEPAIEGMKLKKLFPGKGMPIVQTGEGAWGELDFPQAAKKWGLKKLIPAVPDEDNRPALPVSEAIASANDESLILGDNRGLVRYQFSTHHWERLVRSESKATWTFEKIDRTLFALDSQSHELYEVSLQDPRRVEALEGKFTSIAVTDTCVLALRTNGTLCWLRGNKPGNLPFQTECDETLLVNGPIKSGAVYGNQVAVISPDGRLYRYAFAEGCVQKVSGPWEESNDDERLVEVHASDHVVGVLTNNGRVYRASQLTGPYERVKPLEQLKVTSLGALGHGLVLRHEKGGLEYIAGVSSSPTTLAGGSRPERSPGVLTAALIEGNKLTLGGSKGLAVRSPNQCSLVGRTDAAIGAIDRFELLDQDVFAWTAKGIFLRNASGLFEPVAPRGFNQLIRLTSNRQRNLVSFDAEGNPMLIGLGQDPKPFDCFGWSAVASKSIRRALYLGNGRTLLALQGGGLQTYLESQRKIIQTRQTNDR
jgi:hypothetical protein